jgi:predicted RNA-binding Zn ribbon-like protein
VNTDDLRRGVRIDVLRDFNALVAWLGAAGVLDAERASGMGRRADQQPAGAAAALVDARRVRATLRALAERGATADKVRADALTEINRVLGRSAGTRRVEPIDDGSFRQSFVPVGDAFAGLMIPIVESAAQSLVDGDLPRVRRCADARCPRVFFDATRNGRRRWCDMATCGNRAKAARFRARERTPHHAPVVDRSAEARTA